MLVVASGLCTCGGPGSLDGSGVEADTEGGQLTTAVAAASAGRALVWLSLGRGRVSAGTGSGAVGATATGKKFSRLSLGCFGVVGVSPAACEDKSEVRKAGWVAQSPHCSPGPQSVPDTAYITLTRRVMLWVPTASEATGNPLDTAGDPESLSGRMSRPGSGAPGERQAGQDLQQASPSHFRCPPGRCMLAMTWGTGLQCLMWGLQCSVQGLQ